MRARVSGSSALTPLPPLAHYTLYVSPFRAPELTSELESTLYKWRTCVENEIESEHVKRPKVVQSDYTPPIEQSARARCERYARATH